MSLFYGPGDWLAGRTNARARRAFAAWVLIACIFPGIPAWFLLRNQLWFVGFMSIVALILAMWGVVSAETPVEDEGG
jgi:carbon starvation protein CstA